MSFTALVLRNLLRQRVRSALALLGIAIGITTVVALGVVTAGLKSAMADVVTAGGADFLVAQQGSSDLTFSTVTEAQARAIAQRPDVERADGVAIEVSRVGSNPFFVIFGFDPDALGAVGPPVVRGRALAAGDSGELLLGTRAAEALGAGVGDEVVIERRPFRVAGIYRAPDRWRDGGAIAPLGDEQRLAGRPDVVTGVYVRVAKGRDPVAVATAIERDFPALAAIADVDDYGEVDQGVQILDAVNLAISLLAVGIGAIGVLNTMIMSVYERTRELGILRAVGWRRSRIVRMIVLESLALCLVAAVVGIALGVLLSRAVLLVPAVSSLLVPAYEPDVFVRAVLVGVVVALACAAYPAVRAVRLAPLEALRHE